MLTVSTQMQFDDAIRDGVKDIVIKNAANIHIRDTGKSRIFAGIGADVVLHNDVAITARDNAIVRALDCSTVEARGACYIFGYKHALIIAHDRCYVMADGECHVRLDGDAIAVVYDRVSVTATSRARVNAFDCCKVIASGSATVDASGHVEVIACDETNVIACDTCEVKARPNVVVRLYSDDASVTGGVIIDCIEDKNWETPIEWCKDHNVAVVDGIATLYKAVNDNWTTERGFNYSPGATPVAPDWTDNNKCGGGLHFSPTPLEAMHYYGFATRFVAVGVAIDTLRPIDGGVPKAKAPAVIVPCYEVDIMGDRMEKE